ncbi:HDOD domain-containing protein [Hahella sp. HN01]|uniref:HDOD domain-containing protein n=1 Tax=Hahella sp. HN01 TaxID=2847262 RepID=UPI001C1EA25C|nr:HDOD domain-containing protein [Hahella sp. HN01]MBU6950886.1 HDOD domain-containing protein [Hahella sp. HN01]
MVLAKTKAPFGLDEWLEELAHMDAVVMGAIIRQLNQLTASEESSVAQLSDVVLKTPALTSKIIKLANSAVYNPSRAPIPTVSRAIMHIGFNAVRAICVSSILMEALLKQHPRDSLVMQMARSFHAAVQARNLCDKARADVKEEVFVATLLLHLGEMLIWGYPHPAVDKAYRMYQQGVSTPELESLLGVTFDRLTREMANEWGLGDTLSEALSPPDEPSRKAQAVRLGEDISIAVEKGWDSPEMQAVLKRVSVFSNTPVNTIKAKLQASMEEAAELSREYSDPQISRILEQTSREAKSAELASDEPLLQPDPQFQLETLQRIMQMMAGKIDTGVLFQTVLEGLHRGVGLERVVLAIFNQPRTQVGAKFLVGQKMINWRERFRFAYDKSQDNFFHAVMSSHQSAWIGSGSYASLSKLRTRNFIDIVGMGDFFIGPVIANGREVGFLYADLRVSGRPMSETYYTGFKHFVQQTCLCLSLLAKK